MMRLSLRPATAIAAACALAIPAQAFASYAYYVGKNLTEDGSVMLGGSGEEVSGHWLEIQPREQHPEDAKITVGVTDAAVIPGQRTQIPQVSETYRYISMDYSNWEGFPPPLTNGGLNEFSVAARDVWAPSRAELVEMTPTPQTGPSYSDIARIVMQRAETARDAVEIAGNLIDEHGYSTYGGNSHLFADPEEGWVFIEFAGGEGLWAAERLGPDEVRVSYPGYIGEIPKDCATNHEDAMCSANLVEFAEEQGWYDGGDRDTINVHEVFGSQDAPMRNDAIQFMEERLRQMAPMNIREFISAVRNPAIADDAAGYGQAAHLREGVPSHLAVLWVAPSSSVAAPFIPWYIGVTEVPPEFREHRYLRREAASTYLTPDYALQEATRFAFREWERVLYLACTGEDDQMYPEVVGVLEAFEQESLSDQPWLEAAAQSLIDAGNAEAANNVLTFYSSSRAQDAMNLGTTLAGALEARIKLRSGIPKPPDTTPIQLLDYNMIRCGEHPGEPPL